MYNLVLKSHYSLLKNSLKVFDSTIKKIESNFYQDNALGRHLMGAFINVVPQASQEALQSVTLLLDEALCYNVGIPVNIEKVV